VARAFAFVAVAAFALGATPAAALECTISLGSRAVLSSNAVDPDVFVWDTRSRLVDYAAGQWGNTRTIFAHTVLAGPGTRAMIVACFPGVAHPKFGSGDEDAIGVKVLSGPHRGRFGWVLSSDLHVKAGALGGAPK